MSERDTVKSCLENRKLRAVVSGHPGAGIGTPDCGTSAVPLAHLDTFNDTIRGCTFYPIVSDVPTPEARRSGSVRVLSLIYEDTCSFGH